MSQKATNRRRYLQLTGVAVCAFGAGCVGDDDGDDDEDGDTDDQATTDDQTSVDDSDDSGADDTGTDDTGAEDTDDDDEADAETETVAVGAGGSLEFSPDHLEIGVGTTVEFVWEGNTHNIVVDSQPDGANWEGEESISDEGHSVSHTFDVEGEYEYYCSPHLSAGMEGTIVVT